MVFDRAELERLRARYADDPGGRMHDPMFAPRRRAGVQPRGAAGALRRRADLPDRPAPHRRSRPAGLLRPRRGDHRACRDLGAGTVRARASGRERSGRSSGSAPTTTSSTARRSTTWPSPTSGTCPSEPLRHRVEPLRDRGVGRGDRRGRGAAALGRGRPFDHLSDPPRRRPRRRRSGSSTSTRIPTRAGPSTGCARTTGRRPQRGARGGARPDADHPDRAARSVGVSLRVRHRQRHDLHPCRGGRRDRHSGHRRAGAGGGRRGAGLRLLRHRFARPGLRAGDRDAGDRRADDARGAGAAARPEGARLVGGDVVEVAPQYDATTNTAHAGAQMLFEILSLMVFSPSRREG